MKAIILVLLLSGCAAIDRAEEKAAKESSVTNIVYESQYIKHVGGYGIAGTVYEFTTAKGIDCIFVDGGNASGLQCNWVKETTQ